MLSTGRLNICATGGGVCPPGNTVPLPIPIAGLGEVNVFGNVVGATGAGVGSNPQVGATSVVLIGGTNPTSPATIQSTFLNNGAGSVLSGNVVPAKFCDRHLGAADLVVEQPGRDAADLHRANCSSFNPIDRCVHRRTPVNGIAVWNVTGLGRFRVRPHNLHLRELAVRRHRHRQRHAATSAVPRVPVPLPRRSRMSNVSFNFFNATNVAIRQRLLGHVDPGA